MPPGREDDIDHCDMMKVMLMTLVMMNIWMRMTAEVLILLTKLESVLFAHSSGWEHDFNLSSDTVNT